MKDYASQADAEADAVTLYASSPKSIITYNDRMDIMDALGVRSVAIRFSRVTDKWTIFATDVYRWFKFDVTAKYFEIVDGNKKWKYNLNLNGEIYQNLAFEEIQNKLRRECCSSNGKSAIINPLLSDYLLTSSIPEILVKPVTGYTKEGLISPSAFFVISSNADRSLSRMNFQAVEALTINIADVKKQFKDVYEITSIQHKEVIFAYWMSSHFMFSLKDWTGMIPMLACGSDAGRGKTSIAEFLLQKEGFSLRNVVPTSSFNTPARVDIKLTCDSFLKVIDDCEGMDDKAFMLDTLKESSASKANATRYKADHSYLMNYEYSTPLMLFYNLKPKLLNDTALAQRLILINITQATKNDPSWKDAVNAMKDGELGKYILTQLAALDFKDLLNIYKSMPVGDAYDDRSRAIVKLMNLGQYFLEKWCDIQVTLPDITKLIVDSRTQGNEEIIECVRDFCDPIRENCTWTKESLTAAHYNKIAGFLITHNALLDMQKHLNKKISMNQLGQILRAVYLKHSDKIHYGKHTADNNKKFDSVWLSWEFLQEEYNIKINARTLMTMHETYNKANPNDPIELYPFSQPCGVKKP